MAVIESSCNAASNSFLEQTEWAQRWRLDTSLVGFGEMLPDRGDRVSSATTRAAMGLILRGGCGFLVQSRCAAVAFASGEREGASMVCDQCCRFLYDRFSQEDECQYKHQLFRGCDIPSVLQDASFAAPSFLCANAA